MSIPGEYSFLYYVLINSTIAILGFFGLAFFSGFFRQRIRYYKSSKVQNVGLDQTESCSSPNCVRCRTSLLKKESLLYKLHEFSSSSGRKPELLERLYQSLVEGTRIINKYDTVCARQRPTTLVLLGLASRPWHDDLYGADLLELVNSENLSLIKREVAKLTKTKDFARGWIKNTTPQGCWFVFHLYNQGEKLEWNCKECPRTVELIDRVAPFMKGCAFGNAAISVVSPGTHISSHYGPTNCRIRCHLPLVVPSGCVLKVDHDVKSWEEGIALLFDDSFLHEVLHDGIAGDRIVLMIDLWHPEVTNIEKEAICYLFSEFHWTDSTHS